MSEGTEQDYKETLIDALAELRNLRAKVSAQSAEIARLRTVVEAAKTANVLFANALQRIEATDPNWEFIDSANDAWGILFDALSDAERARAALGEGE